MEATAASETAGDVCPLCGAGASFGTAHAEDDVLLAVRCPRCGEFRISPEDAVRIGEVLGADGEEEPSSDLHLVSGYLREMTLLGSGGIRVRPESISAMIAAAPRSVPDRADRLLLNLAGLSRFAGHRVDIDYEHDHVLSYSRYGGETAFLMEHLIAEGLVDREPGAYARVAVGVGGWGRVEKLRAPGRTHSQGFVAMSFEPALLPLYDDAIAPAIRDAGFDPFVIAEHEHVGQIDDRILLELNRSRFVVAEFTGHRPNVYFEAGYALGRGIPVIWTCREEDIEDAHFDTRQYNHVLWSSPRELRENLRRRIELVVG